MLLKHAILLSVWNCQDLLTPVAFKIPAVQAGFQGSSPAHAAHPWGKLNLLLWEWGLSRCHCWVIPKWHSDHTIQKWNICLYWLTYPACKFPPVEFTIPQLSSSLYSTVFGGLIHTQILVSTERPSWLLVTDVEKKHWYIWTSCRIDIFSPLSWKASYNYTLSQR